VSGPTRIGGEHPYHEYSWHDLSQLSFGHSASTPPTVDDTPTGQDEQPADNGTAARSVDATTSSDDWFKFPDGDTTITVLGKAYGDVASTKFVWTKTFNKGLVASGKSPRVAVGSFVASVAVRTAAVRQGADARK